MSENINSDINIVEEDEIDLIQLAKTLWSGRRTVIKYVVISVVIGIFIAIITPNSFSSSTVVVSQSSEAEGGSLSGLAAMAGFNIGGSSGESLSAELYPNVVVSKQFNKELMHAPILSGIVDGKNISLYDYFIEYHEASVLGIIKKYTIGLPGVIIGAIKGDPEESLGVTSLSSDIISLSEDEKDVYEEFLEIISITVDDKVGSITIGSTMPEALLTAQVTQKVKDLLQEYITKFKIEKAQSNLEFVQKQYNSKNSEYLEAHRQLALFTDQNNNVVTAVAQMEREKLTREYNLIYGVVSELAKQLESAKISVNEDTPIFTVVEPVSVPFEKSAPKRSMMVIMYAFLGAVIGVGVVFGKSMLKEVKTKWEEAE